MVVFPLNVEDKKAAAAWGTLGVILREYLILRAGWENAKKQEDECRMAYFERRTFWFIAALKAGQPTTPKQAAQLVETYQLALSSERLQQAVQQALALVQSRTKKRPKKQGQKKA